MQFKVIARARKDLSYSQDYPIEVVAVIGGKEQQPTQCRDRAQALCVGNGMISGLIVMANAYGLYLPGNDRPDISANVEFQGDLA